MTVIHHTEAVQLHDHVELARRVERFSAGTKGVVVDAYPARDVYTVEVTDEHGHLVELLPCHAVDLRILH